MNRRQFATVLAGLTGVAAGPSTTLEAIVAERTPQLLVIDGIEIASDDTRIFEMRVYGEAAFHAKTQSSQRRQRPFFFANFASLREMLLPVFHRAGIRPLLSGNLAYLIPFESFAARQAAWNAVSADPEWTQVRERVGRVSQVAIYRRYPGGRILDMSL